MKSNERSNQGRPPVLHGQVVEVGADDHRVRNIDELAHDPIERRMKGGQRVELIELAVEKLPPCTIAGVGWYEALLERMSEDGPG